MLMWIRHLYTLMHLLNPPYVLQRIPSPFDLQFHRTQKKMSQRQPRRPQGQADQASDQEAIKYGDVFDVTGGLACKPVAPRDAATMRTAENQVLGKTLDAGAASVMQSAADLNVMSGVVGRDQGNEMVEREGVSVSKSRDVQGKVVVTEAVADQVKYIYVPWPF